MFRNFNIQRRDKRKFIVAVQFLYSNSISIEKITEIISNKIKIYFSLFFFIIQQVRERLRVTLEKNTSLEDELNATKDEVGFLNYI